VTRRGETASTVGVQRWTEVGDGPTVLLLHGIYAAAGGHEWDALVPRLATTHTVRVPDLLGFGTSDHPRRAFTPDLVAAAVDALVADVPPSAVVVASSLTAAYALRVLDGRGDRSGRGVVFVTPTGLRGPQSGTGGGGPAARVGEAVEALWRRTPVGDLLASALVSEPSLRWFLRRQAYSDPAKVTPATIAAHRRAADHPDRKYPLVAFVANGLAQPVDPAAVARVRPTVVWGGGQKFTPARTADAWEAAGATVVRLGSGLPQAEEPEAVAEVVRAAR
jgi:hypothetical protein